MQKSCHPQKIRTGDDCMIARCSHFRQPFTGVVLSCHSLKASAFRGADLPSKPTNQREIQRGSVHTLTGSN